MQTAYRRGRPISRDPVRTRDRLVQAAFGEIYRSGFRGSDVDTILTEAGVTKGALYHHFADKDALGHAVVDEVIAEIMRDKWQRPLEGAEDPIEALIGIVRGTSLKPAHVACGCPLNNMSQEMAPLDEGFRKRTAQIFQDWQQAIAAALRAGKANGTVRPDVDPDAAAMFLVATYEGFMSLGKCFRDARVLRSGVKALEGYLEALRPAGQQPRRR